MVHFTSNSINLLKIRGKPSTDKNYIKNNVPSYVISNISDFLIMLKYFSLKLVLLHLYTPDNLTCFMAISELLKQKLVACFIPKPDFNFHPLQLLIHNHNKINPYMEYQHISIMVIKIIRLFTVYY
jgi:hypothetical protein